MTDRAPPFVFFYGTLTDGEVCRAVLGRRAEALARVPAVLPGFRRVRARSGNYPMLVRASGGRVEGQGVSGLDRAALTAIAFYEGPLYLPWPVRVLTPGGSWRSAWVFLARIGGLSSGWPWNEARWRQRDRARLIRDARRWKAELDRRDWVPHEVPWRARRRIDEIMA